MNVKKNFYFKILKTINMLFFKDIYSNLKGPSSIAAYYLFPSGASTFMRYPWRRCIYAGLATKA